MPFGLFSQNPSEPSETPVLENPPENDFAQLWNEWVIAHAEEHYNPLMLNARAVVLWKDLKRQWKVLEKHVDNQY